MFLPSRVKMEYTFEEMDKRWRVVTVEDGESKAVIVVQNRHLFCNEPTYRFYEYHEKPVVKNNNEFIPVTSEEFVRIALSVFKNVSRSWTSAFFKTPLL